MTESAWQSATEPGRMLEFLKTSDRASERKLRLFACACCRAIWRLMPDERSRRAVETAELLAEGLADLDELAIWRTAAERRRTEAQQQEDRSGARIHVLDLPSSTRVMAATAAVSCAHPNAGPDGEAAWWAHADAADAGASEVVGARFRATGDYRGALPSFGLRRRVEWSAQGHLLRDIFGNPFQQKFVPDLRWLDCNDGTVRRLAEDVHQERELPAGTLEPVRLSILADALEEAGCAAGILDHLRGPGPHVRGCFVIDALLGRS
jgi:hypothetical protein